MLLEGWGDLTEGHLVQQRSQTAPCSTYCSLALLCLLWQVFDTWRRKHKAETGCMAKSKCPFFRNFRNFLTFDHMQDAALLGIIMEHKCKAAAVNLTTLLSGPNLSRATQQISGKQPVLALLLLQHLRNWEGAPWREHTRLVPSGARAGSCWLVLPASRGKHNAVAVNGFCRGTIPALIWS